MLVHWSEPFAQRAKDLLSLEAILGLCKLKPSNMPLKPSRSQLAAISRVIKGWNKNVPHRWLWLATLLAFSFGDAATFSRPLQSSGMFCDSLGLAAAYKWVPLGISLLQHSTEHGRPKPVCQSPESCSGVYACPSQILLPELSFAASVSCSCCDSKNEAFCIGTYLQKTQTMQFHKVVLTLLSTRWLSGAN